MNLKKRFGQLWTELIQKSFLDLIFHLRFEKHLLQRYMLDKEEKHW